MKVTYITVEHNPLVFIRHFEKLYYDTAGSAETHQRIKRDDTAADVRFTMESHERQFRLRLRRDRSAFAGNHQLDLSGIPQIPDLSFLYSGTLEGDEGSYVYGSVLDGIFDGHIHTSSGDIFHVEKATKYYGNSAANLSFHSIIYHDNDIDESKIRVKRSAGADSASQSGCGLHGSVRSWMESVQHSSSIPFSNIQSERSEQSPTSKKTVLSDDTAEGNFFRNKYADPAGQRWKRQLPVKDEKGHYNVRTCSLYMQTDQKLFDHVFRHEGQGDRKRTQEEIITLINNHIKAVNAIYEGTDFEGINGFNFVVQRTTVYDDTSCPNTFEEEIGNPFCQENVDVSNYLNRNSIRNHSDFCLAYALTFRDFDGGTLGLAWVASPSQSVRGGICEVFQQYTEGTKHVKRSLNTGIITLVNYNNRVPPKVSQLTLAHEIGHNFGSPHDFPLNCIPGLPDGNFIMFASATSGDKTNNAKFSPCSIRNISQVLHAVLSQAPTQSVNSMSGKRNCFLERKGPFCGNQLVEDGEECDCGFDDNECKHRQDDCCFARQNSANAQGCRLKVSAKCSPSQGFCCSSQCDFHQATQECRDASECTEKRFCTGASAICPPSPPKPDDTVCGEHTKMCRSGAFCGRTFVFRIQVGSLVPHIHCFKTCNASICETIGQEECFLTRGDNAVKCQLACMPKQGDPKKDCKSSFQLPKLAPHYQKVANGKGILLRPGSPCDDFNGYCDVFRKCRSVDSNGPLSRLKELFSPEALQNITAWVERYWWAVVLMGIALVLFMALFIKCCAVHTPSSNPRKPPAQSIYETLRHPSTLVRAQRRNRQPNCAEFRATAGAMANHSTAQQHRNQHRRHSRQRRNDNGSIEPAENGTAVALSHASAFAEQPPPYSAVVVEPTAVPLTVYASGPARGHRKKKDPAGKKPARGTDQELRTRRSNT